MSAYDTGFFGGACGSLDETLPDISTLAEQAMDDHHKNLNASPSSPLLKK